MFDAKIESAVVRRLIKEQANLKDSPYQFFSIAPEEKDLFIWKGILFGPENSCYEGGAFNIKFEIPFDYPMKPPKCYFMTKIYHPNIFSDTGHICLNILQDKNWSPALDLEKVLISIHSLLAEPNFNHKVVDSTGKEVYHEITALGQADQEQFKRIARQWVSKYAQL